LGTQATNQKVVLSAEQIQKRVTELARQINSDYAGKTIYVLTVLPNGFIFGADLVRQLEVRCVCSFVRPESKETVQGGAEVVEIFFTPEEDVKDKDVLLIETLVQSGVTSEFLMRNLTSRGAKSVRLCVLLDKQSERRVQLTPDYFGFLVESSYMVGYGLGAPDVGRNFPYIASVER
jgi:hypoxanthine phosphoribosyltransferase